MVLRWATSNLSYVCTSPNNFVKKSSPSDSAATTVTLEAAVVRRVLLLARLERATQDGQAQAVIRLFLVLPSQVTTSGQIAVAVALVASIM